MKILGKSVSPKTEALITKLEKLFRYPVDYYPIDTRPNGRGKSAGTVDVYPEDGKYRIWLDADLPKEAFEADILHELHHITQTESGFPNVFNKGSEDFRNNQSFIKDLGTHIGSVILDIDVNHWLSENGYSYSFFTLSNYQVMLHNQQKFPLLNDPLNFAELCLGIVHASLYVDDQDAEALSQHYSQYPGVKETVSKIRKELLSISHFSPQTATFAMGFIIDTLNLWKWFFVGVHPTYIRTRKEYDAFKTISETVQVVFIPLNISRQPVSAGKGIFLGEEEMDKILVQENPLTSKAVFAVRVSGDSMMPQFLNGDILLVDNRTELNPGEIGVFTLNGEGYIKKLGNNELISLDSAYAPIPMNSSIRCNGHVIGKLKAEWIQGRSSI